MAKREIVTKTILSKTKKAFHEIVSIQDGDVSKVLGCWLLNPVLRYEKRTDDAIVVSGNYDINLWVGVHENTSTKCIIQLKDFTHTVVFDGNQDQVMGELIVHARWMSKPVCTKAEYANQNILLGVDMEVQLEWIGETKIRVELAEDEIDQIIDDAIDTQYLLK